VRAILYVASGCEHCARLRRDLERTGTPFETIDVSARREVVPELLKLTRGRRVVPVLVDDRGVHVAPQGGSAF
jgi:glutaredoxin